MRDIAIDIINLLKQIGNNFKDYMDNSRDKILKISLLHKIKHVFLKIICMYNSYNILTEFEKDYLNIIEKIAHEYNTIIMFL